jgi:hypothetical protein
MSWDLTQRTAEGAQEQELRNEVAELTKNMSSVLATLNGVAPSIASAQRDLQSAKTQKDPRAKAALVERASANQQYAGDSAEGLFVALAPSMVRQIRSWKGDWNSPDGRALILNANYLRRGLLQPLQITPDDQAAAGMFSLYPGGYTKWNAEEASRYIESLAARSRIPSPPALTSVEVK